MKKYVLISLLEIIISLPAFSQYTEQHRKDSLEIDSLKRALPLLKDSARIDCLNRISDKHQGFWLIGFWPARHDSMSKYASIAYAEANRIGYKKGILRALLCLGKSELYFARSVPNSQKLITQAVSLAIELNDDNLTGDAYALLSDWQGKNHDIHNDTTNLKAIYYFHKGGDLQGEAEWTTWLAGGYIENGDYEKGFPYCVKAIELTKKSAHDEWGYELVQYALSYMSELFQLVRDYETSMDYIRQAEQYGLAHGMATEDALLPVDKALLFNQMEQTDSALYYWKIVLNGGPNNPFMKVDRGETLLALKQYDTALNIFLNNMDTIRNFKANQHLYAKCLLDIAHAYAGKKNYNAALKYAVKSFTLIQKYYRRLVIEGRHLMMESDELLANLYHHLGNDSKAYDYLKRYTTLKDSLQNQRFLWRLDNQLNNYKKQSEEDKKQAQILLLNKDNQIKNAQLKQESIIKNFLVAGLFFLLMAGVFIFRSISLKRKTEKLQHEQQENNLRVQQLENEKKQAELQQQAATLEMQALRAQMNPHFIFNSLSSINHFILKNESKTASGYLTRFSRLIRMVLINSQKSLINLEDELEMLRIYLEMERLRFKNAFNYSITFLNAINSDTIYIPPLLLQPFCENAIWHGLMNKDGLGKLDIELGMENNTLYCIITDNGIGREKAEEMKSKSAEKEKSMGLKITADRLSLLNAEKGIDTSYTIEDLKDEQGEAAGTRVNLKISIMESTDAIIK